MLFNESARPGSLLVDQRGRRFADESQNYNDLGRALLDFSPTYEITGSCLAGVRRRVSLPLRAGHGDATNGSRPADLLRADSVAALALRINVPDVALVESVERFNVAAERGEDPDFGRGSSAWGRLMGDRAAAHPNLGPLRAAPFYAVQVLPGCLETKGGPRTDPDGHVLRVDGDGVVPGCSRRETSRPVRLGLRTRAAEARSGRR